ncbi:MAG TPA: hypothetical protein VN962_28340 [Polyangia bacterium]|nr:hypothetical protein [Polyangia bacterium]
MRRSLFGVLAATALAALVGVSSDANAAIAGVVSIPSNVCSQQTATSRAWCPYFSYNTAYVGSSVADIYVDAYLYTSSAIQAKACEQSYSTGAFYCGSYGSATGSNVYRDVHVPGFASISGAPKIIWDYYLVYMDNASGGTFDILGVGYL